MSDKATVVASKSSNIQSIGYDEDARVLYVTFRSGARYSYAGVPAKVHAELAALKEGESLGKAFHAKVKGQYPHEKL